MGYRAKSPVKAAARRALRKRQK